MAALSLHQPRISPTRIDDVTIHNAWGGPGRLQLVQHDLASLSDLPVLEIGGVSHMLTDLALLAATVADDDLVDDKEGAQ